MTNEIEQPPSFWWAKSDLRYHSDRLIFGNGDLETIARRFTPTFVVRPKRAAENLALLRTAAPEIDVYYAVKANRHPLLLKTLQNAGIDGMDVCSPNEVRLALGAGFAPERLSYTGTSVSNADLAFLASEPDVHVNADSLAMLRRLLDRSAADGITRRKTVGLRVNPEIGLGYRDEERLTYSGTGPISKFGILAEQIDEAQRIARARGAAITTLHWHVGCGWLGNQLEQFEAVLRRGIDFAEQFHDLERINLGGGIGVPLAADDTPVDLAAWHDTIRRLVAGRWRISIEPGAFLVQNTTLLLVEAATVEPKRSEWLIGVNAGFNLLMEPVFYGMPAEIVPLRLPDPEAPKSPCYFVGNINEAHDRHPQRLLIPLPAEGDYFALLNAGAYGTSMASNHCLRGDFREEVVD